MKADIIENEWKKISDTFEEVKPDYETKAIRAVFYAGAALIFSEIVAVDSKPKDEVKQLLTGLQTELATYAVESLVDLVDERNKKDGGTT